MQGEINSPNTGQTISNWGLTHSEVEENGKKLTKGLALIDDFCGVIFPQETIEKELSLANHMLLQQLDNSTRLSEKDKPLKISP